MQKVEDIGLAVAEQMEPNQDGYKALTISSGGKVGLYEYISITSSNQRLISAFEVQ